MYQCIYITMHVKYNLQNFFSVIIRSIEHAIVTKIYISNILILPHLKLSNQSCQYAHVHYKTSQILERYSNKELLLFLTVNDLYYKQLMLMFLY